MRKYHLPRQCHPGPAFVIPDLQFVIPDLIRDPVPRMHWIAGRARNDIGRGRNDIGRARNDIGRGRNDKGRGRDDNGISATHLSLSRP